MALPTIDTFEKDIATEVKQKEASLVSIATASGDISDTPLPEPPTSPKILIASIFFILCIVMIGVAGYIYYMRITAPVIPDIQNITSVEQKTELSQISPQLSQSIGQDITKIEKKEYGYILTLQSYSPVFSYMIKNESSFGDEIAASLGASRDTTSTTSQAFVFTDVTENNQNMRVATSDSHTIVYAFIGNQYLVFASSTEGILALRTSVLTQ